MARKKSERFEPRCSLCNRMMNDASDLTWMYNLERDSIHICSASRCWTQAKERGYATEYQRREDRAPGP